MDTKKSFATAIFVLVILLLLITIIGSSRDGIQIIKLNKMNNDIELLDERIRLYYLDNGSLPITDKKIDNFSFSSNPNDNEVFYEIDLSKLEDLNIELGRKQNGDDDFYIINEKSFTVYYLKGVKYKDKDFYTRDLDYEKVNIEEYN